MEETSKNLLRRHGGFPPKLGVPLKVAWGVYEGYIEDVFFLWDSVASQSKGTLTYTSIYCNPYYKDPNKVPPKGSPNFGIPAFKNSGKSES